MPHEASRALGVTRDGAGRLAAAVSTCRIRQRRVCHHVRVLCRDVRAWAWHEGASEAPIVERRVGTSPRPSSPSLVRTECNATPRHEQRRQQPSERRRGGSITHNKVEGGAVPRLRVGKGGSEAIRTRPYEPKAPPYERAHAGAFARSQTARRRNGPGGVGSLYAHTYP